MNPFSMFLINILQIFTENFFPLMTIFMCKEGISIFEANEKLMRDNQDARIYKVTNGQKTLICSGLPKDYSNYPEVKAEAKKLENIMKELSGISADSPEVSTAETIGKRTWNYPLDFQ
jgi:hypothetical protein